MLVHQIDCHAGCTYSYMGPIVSMQVAVIRVGHFVNKLVALHCTGRLQVQYCPTGRDVSIIYIY